MLEIHEIDRLIFLECGIPGLNTVCNVIVLLRQPTQSERLRQGR